MLFRSLVETLVHKQHLAELQGKLDSLHSADIAYILEALPRDERILGWDMVKAERDGEILLEVSDAVRESLIESMAPAELVAAAFDAAAALDKLEGFASFFGADFYGLPRNSGQVTLRRREWTLPETVPFGAQQLKPLCGGETLAWQLSDEAAP